MLNSYPKHPFYPSKLERTVSHPPNLLDPEIRLSELLPKKPRPCDKSTAMKRLDGLVVEVGANDGFFARTLTRLFLAGGARYLLNLIRMFLPLWNLANSHPQQLHPFNLSLHCPVLPRLTLLSQPQPARFLSDALSVFTPTSVGGRNHGGSSSVMLSDHTRYTIADQTGEIITGFLKNLGHTRVYFPEDKNGIHQNKGSAVSFKTSKRRFVMFKSRKDGFSALQYSLLPPENIQDPRNIPQLKPDVRQA